jgi:hypothetical protein
MANDPNVIREGGYQGIKDLGYPPSASYGPQIKPVEDEPIYPFSHNDTPTAIETVILTSSTMTRSGRTSIVTGKIGPRNLFASLIRTQRESLQVSLRWLDND